MHESDYFLIIIASARHLDYTDCKGFSKTLVKHPDTGRKNCDIGHVWMYLQGVKDGRKVYLNGGHTGDFGVLQPHYFDGLLEMHAQGDPNPIRILWRPYFDGMYEDGHQGFYPTYAAKFDLSEKDFDAILKYLESYDYHCYSLYNHQCCNFVTRVASIAGIELDTTFEMEIDQEVDFFGEKVRLWSDPMYSRIELNNPDMIEKALMEAVEEGRAEYALPWYTRRFQCRPGLNVLFRDLVQFPCRLLRAYYIFRPGFKCRLEPNSETAQSPHCGVGRLDRCGSPLSGYPGSR